jgi:hypothetical protein
MAKEQKSTPKTGKRNNKGKLGKEHPAIKFLADLISHRVRTFAKYLYALKKVGIATSEMNGIDCLKLKQNYAWWLSSNTKLPYEEFKDSARSPILHHFNDHSKCGTWCKHTKKNAVELKKLKKYQCKEKNAKLYLQCNNIKGCFLTEETLC